MVGLFSFLGILFLSLTIIRIATVMLRFTGLSKDIAAFQARSAFTTTGFTAQESEIIMNHPIRRNIIQNLMILGNVGFVSFISSFILTMISDIEEFSTITRLGILVGGSLALLVLTRLPAFDSIISWVVQKVLKKNIRIYRKDYDSLLFLAGDFEIIKAKVNPETWLVERSLSDLSLADEGVLVIGIHREDGYFIGSPRGSTVLYPGDLVVLYGKEERLKDLTMRKAGIEGNALHEQMVREQRMMEGLTPEPSDKQKIQTTSRKIRSVVRRLRQTKDQ